MIYFFNNNLMEQPGCLHSCSLKFFWLRFLCVCASLWLPLNVTPIFGQNLSVSSEIIEVEDVDQSIEFFTQKALQNNPQYQAVLHETGQTKYMYESETMFMENPMFSFGLVNVPISTFPSLKSDTMSSMSFMLEQEIALPGESLSRKKMAFEEFLAKEKDAEALRRMLIVRVEAVCYDLIFLYQKRNLLIENRQALEGIVSVTRSLVSVNKMNSAQLLKIEARLSQMDGEIMETKGIIVRAESELENISAQKPEEKKLILTRLAPENIKIPTGFNPENHPMYKAAEAMFEGARAKKDHETAKYFPSLKFAVDYMVRQPIQGVSMSGDDMVTLRVTATLPLFFAFKESKSVQAADEGIKKADRFLEETALRLKTSWDAEYGMSENLLKIYTNYHVEILPRYYASYKAMLGGLSSSQVSFLDVLDSYRDYLEVSIKEAEVYRDLLKSISMLKYLKGIDVPVGNNTKN